MIVGFIGRMGSGKTLSMVKYAYEYYKLGYKIYSNIKLNFPYTEYTINELVDYANNDTTFYKSVVLCDEMHIMLDSRASGSKRNRIITYFLLQTRKRDVKLFYTTQFFHQVDKRLRSNTDMIILNNTRVARNGEQYTLNLFIQTTELGRTLKKHVVFKSKNYFNLYNTYEVVKMV